MSSFHHAFFALFTLIGRSQPWNKSLEVLWLFFINNQWFEKAVVNSAGYTRHEKVFPAHICAQFTDHFLLVSSSRFTNKQCHVTIHEVDALFKNFCQSNLRLFKTGYNASSTVTSQSSTSSTSKPFKRPFSLNTPGSVYIDIGSICYNYNTSVCFNKYDSNINSCTDRAGHRTYLHVCSYRMPTGRPCGSNHPRSKH